MAVRAVGTPVDAGRLVPVASAEYGIRIWERDRRRHPKDEQLRLIVPLVLYQGERGWRIACEFSELFPAEVRGWPGVGPRGRPPDRRRAG